MQMNVLPLNQIEYIWRDLFIEPAANEKLVATSFLDVVVCGSSIPLFYIGPRTEADYLLQVASNMMRFIREEAFNISSSLYMQLQNTEKHLYIKTIDVREPVSPKIIRSYYFVAKGDIENIQNFSKHLEEKLESYNVAVTGYR